jgi:Xaa-Pro aminopeptidase
VTGKKADMDSMMVFYRRARAGLAAMLPARAIALIFSNDEMHRNGDQNFPFRQNSDLLYLSGIEQEQSLLILCPGHPDITMRECLVIRESNPMLETWEGHKLSKQEASEVSGIAMVIYPDQFSDFLRDLMSQCDVIYLNSNEYPKYHNDNPDRQTRLNREVQSEYPGHRYQRLAPLLWNLRVIKQDEEIRLMQKACDITGEAFHAVLRHLQAGQMEYEVEALINYEFRRHGATGSAYQSIVASGKSAVCLHYTENDKKCLDGSLLLLDFGCEWKGYASDLSRTIPVNGRFSIRQKQLYQAVLDVFHRAKNLFVPGNSIDLVNRKVWGWMEEKMIELGLFSTEELSSQDPAQPLRNRYLPHGISHFIGLDVHDVGSKEQVFEPGMVLTCEPGLYLPDEGIGIRIETDLLITNAAPIDLFEGLPVEIDEIEKIMSNQ